MPRRVRHAPVHGVPLSARALSEKSSGIDTTTLEANAAKRSILRRDTGED
jgi:hypothetical protein